ncbi:MAG: hypothetical protein QXP86_04795 [Nitrososphaerota archaeon]
MLILKLEDVLGKKVLIAGEAGTGKTMLLVKLLEEANAQSISDAVTLIDLAPKKIGEFGGRVVDYLRQIGGIRLLMPVNVFAPRLSGKTKDEVMSLAEKNREAIEPLLKGFLSKPTRILFINDLTIYLHAGDPELLEKCIEVSETFVGTAYYGTKLQDDKGSGITLRERMLAERIMKKVDKVIFLE